MGVKKNQANGLDEKSTPVVLPCDPENISLEEAVVATPSKGEAVLMENPPEVIPAVEKEAPRNKATRSEKEDDEMDI